MTSGAKRLEILTRLRENNPHPTTKLNFSSLFKLLIAVLPSAQVTDINANRATTELYPVANTPAAMLELGVEGVKTYIKMTDLYSNKAKSIIKTYRILLEQHNSEVPENRATLKALSGVGRKTANVVLNTAFSWPAIAVDTYIFRVYNRTQFAPGKNVEQVERKPLEVVPAEFKVGYHHWLILHGCYTCITRKPRCGSCIIEDLYGYKEKVDIQRSEVTPTTLFITSSYPLLKHLFNVNDAIVQRYHQIIHSQITRNAG